MKNRALIGFGGAMVMMLDTIGDSEEGDVVAFAGAVTMSDYVVFGKWLRDQDDMPIWLYSFPVTLVAVFVTVFASLIFEPVTFGGIRSHTVFGFFATEFILFALYLGAGSGVLGHTLINTLLKHLSPLVCTTALLLEPLVGALLGAAFGYQVVFSPFVRPISTHFDHFLNPILAELTILTIF